MYNIPLIAIKRPCVDLASTIDFYEVGCPKMKVGVNAAKTPNFPTYFALTPNFHPTSNSFGKSTIQVCLLRSWVKVGSRARNPSTVFALGARPEEVTFMGFLVIAS